jgi:Ca2+-binding RTX toxin-like protein
LGADTFVWGATDNVNQTDTINDFICSGDKIDAKALLYNLAGMAMCNLEPFVSLTTGSNHQYS